VPLVMPIAYAVGLAPGTLAGSVLLVGSTIMAVLSARTHRSAWIPPAVLVGLVLASYLGTLLPSLGQADTFEFQVVVAKLGVAHPTGYPLYILLTKLFTFLPVRTVAWRVSLASAVYATGAVLVLYLLIRRLTGRMLPAFLGALMLAFSSVFWSQALVAEVYTLNALLVVSIVVLLMPVRQNGGQCQPHRRWWPTALLLGLSLTNHLTTALLVPAVFVALVWDRPRLSLRQRALACVLFLAGLAIYAFIPLRWPALNNGSALPFHAFLRHITGRQFGGALRIEGLLDAERWGIAGRLLRAPMGLPVLALAAVGVAVLALRDRRGLVITGAIFAAYFGYGLAYRVPDVGVFLIPVHIVLAIWAGIGTAAIADQARKWSGCRLAQAVLVAAAFVPMSLMWRNLPQVDLSRSVRSELRGRSILARPLAPDSAILADPVRFAPLYYVQQIEGVRPDIDIVLLADEESYRQELSSRLAEGQTTYLARYLPGVEHYRLRSVGPLVQVSLEPFAEEVVPEHPLDVKYGDAITLVGADLDASSPRGAAGPGVRLLWTATAGPGLDYLVRLRLVDAAGAVVWEADPVRPVGGLYPTGAWRPGEVVADYHELLLPPCLESGTYSLEVGLLTGYSGPGVPVDDGDGQWARALQVPVSAIPPAGLLPSSARILAGDTRWVTGHDAPREAIAGTPFDFAVSWRMAPGRQAEARGAPALFWDSCQGEHIGQIAGPVRSPPSGQSQVLTRYTIDSPAKQGEYDLALGWIGPDGGLEPIACGWLSPPAPLCALQKVAVTPAREGIVSFDDLILMLDVDVAVDAASPGDVIPVQIRWRALRRLTDDYTVFVQLVGPDGRLHGQVDAWPVQGTLPTSSWEPASDVLDSYEVQLDPDAPSGRYAVHIGWYLLETMERLPLVTVRGESYADYHMAAEISVAPVEG
jgi:hypothetical protein